jgi:hypothetical protein
MIVTFVDFFLLSTKQEVTNLRVNGKFMTAARRSRTKDVQESLKQDCSIQLLKVVSQRAILE